MYLTACLPKEAELTKPKTAPPWLLKGLERVLEGVFLLSFLALLLVSVPRLLGYDFVTIESGSMSPAIPVGSACFTRQVTGAEIKEEDVITFYAANKDGLLVTHRVAKVTKDGTFVTKGDANEEADTHVVTEKELFGKVLFSVPVLGFVLCYLSFASSKQAAIFCICLLIFGILLLDAKQRPKSKKQGVDSLCSE